jgi:hypothetical protein
VAAYPHGAAQKDFYSERAVVRAHRMGNAQPG